jgi:hypothetical protein
MFCLFFSDEEAVYAAGRTLTCDPATPEMPPALNRVSRLTRISVSSMYER